MKYGLTRYLQIYSLTNHDAETVIAAAGDYLQSQLWCNKHLKGIPEGIVDLYQTFAWAWFAMSRNGLLERFELDSELSLEQLNKMADTVTVYLEEIKDDQLPLATQASKSQK